MKQLILSCVLLTALAFAASGQNLFSYGKKTVSRDEFMRNFLKNSNNLTGDRQASLRENLDLYIRYKLKVQAAYDLRYDTLINQREELNSFRRQIEGNYLKEDRIYNLLLDEAFQRSQKDIRVSHIMINYVTASKKIDTVTALKRVNDLQRRLRNGEDFGKLAAEISDDPSVKETRGDLGYVTVFSLPYDMENIIYSTPLNQVASVHKSSYAYHIFKVTGVRKAMGRMKAAQILIAFPPDADATQKASVAAYADTIYKKLQKGELFENLARSFSNDYVTAQSGGVLPEFGVGKYDPVFEMAVYNLQNTGDYSKPFATSYGYHIVQKLENIPVSDNRQDEGAMRQLSEQIKNDSRSEVMRDAFTQTIIKTIGYRPAPINRARLLLLTDTVMLGQTPQDRMINDKTLLHTVGKQPVTVGNFWQFTRDARNTNQYRNKNSEQMLNEYIKATAFEYYRDHLEEFNTDFRYQYMEFKDGNLLFEAMEKNVWNKSAMDSVGLMKQYNANKTKYKWDRSADAIIFTTGDLKIAQEIQDKIKKNPANWRDIMTPYYNNGTAQADSSRYLLGDIPVAEKTSFANGLCTEPFNLGNDGSASFTYVVKVYGSGDQKSFEEARGQVINDYQQVLEEKWIADLKKKYPIKVNEPVWQDLLKKGK
jgi:peptidyl-prolyl cis-trans isomerase SurA